jgi:hypothetical protein
MCREAHLALGEDIFIKQKKQIPGRPTAPTAAATTTTAAADATTAEATTTNIGERWHQPAHHQGDRRQLPSPPKAATTTTGGRHQHRRRPPPPPSWLAAAFVELERERVTHTHTHTHTHTERERESQIHHHLVWICREGARRYPMELGPRDPKPPTPGHLPCSAAAITAGLAGPLSPSSCAAAASHPAAAPHRW